MSAGPPARTILTRKLGLLQRVDGKSYPFLAVIDGELARLIPHSRPIVFADAGHQIWLQHPVECRDDVEALFREKTINAP
jgi:pimeloyl-ACP methyl ester carboxylesterase